MNATQLREIFARTSAHCHFCGDSIAFENRGWCEKPNGRKSTTSSSAIKVVPKRRKTVCLPVRAAIACAGKRTDDGIRELLLLGVIAAKEIKDKTEIGKAFERLKYERLDRNIARRTRANKPVRQMLRGAI